MVKADETLDASNDEAIAELTDSEKNVQRIERIRAWWRKQALVLTETRAEFTTPEAFELELELLKRKHYNQNINDDKYEAAEKTLRDWFIKKYAKELNWRNANA